MKHLLKVLCICLLVVSCSKKEEATPKDTDLVIQTSTGNVKYNLEIATTTEEQKKGLMFREAIPENSGMIFDIEPIRPVTMWMKNTQIPLDMLFIDASGTIIQIQENAEPYSEAYIVCSDPVKAVVEINGGQAEKNGIKVGDKVDHKILESLKN